MKAGIAAGTFNFGEEFPDFRGLHKLPLPLRAQACSDVFDAFLCHEEMRVAIGDLAPATLASHRQSLDHVNRSRDPHGTTGFPNRLAVDSPVAGGSVDPNAGKNDNWVRTRSWRCRSKIFELAERVGFEPTCRFYPTIRFRVGAVMTASVPLRPCPKSLKPPHYG
jgi:hypothetical protein